MTSPSPLRIPPPPHADHILLDARTTDYPISHIFGMLIKPKRGCVLPDFLKYQSEEQLGVGQDGEGVAQRAVDKGKDPLTVPVCILSTSDLAEIHCTPDEHHAPNTTSNYHHSDREGQFHFVPPGHAQQLVEEAVQEANTTASTTKFEVEPTPITPYIVTSDDNKDHNSDKENCLEAEAIQWVLYELETPRC